jgi:very-short-patch-repair endonuclease
MPSHHELREAFGDEPFGVREALARGFTENQLRHPALLRPHVGTRSLARTGESLVERALACLPSLRPGDRFSHATALALLGCPIRVDAAAPIDVEASPGETPLRRAGVRGHRSGADSTHFLLRVPETDSPVPIVLPRLALLQSCSVLPFTEAVVAADSLVRGARRRFDPASGVDLSLLTTWAGGLEGRRGARRFRAAVRLARVGADSRMETLTRLAGERAGLTGLTLQRMVRDPHGAAIGYFDLADEESRTLFEFDGEQHRLHRAQYLRDLSRHERARDAGWRVLRFHREDVVDRFLETGGRMVEATGRAPAPVPPTLRRLLDERASPGTRSALPRTPIARG